MSKRGRLAMELLLKERRVAMWDRYHVLIPEKGAENDDEFGDGFADGRMPDEF